MNDGNAPTTTTGKSYGFSTTSLGFGLLSGLLFFFSVVAHGVEIAGPLGILTGILAVVTGAVGFYKASEQPSLFGGTALAVAGFLIGLASSVWLGVGAFCAHSYQQLEADDYFCTMNARVIWAGAKTYAYDHQNQFPPDFATFSKELAEANWHDFTSRSEILTRTRAIHKEKNCGYEFLGANQKDKDSADQAILYCPLHHLTLMGDGSVRGTDAAGRISP